MYIINYKQTDNDEDEDDDELPRRVQGLCHSSIFVRTLSYREKRPTADNSLILIQIFIVMMFLSRHDASCSNHPNPRVNI